LLLAKRGMYPLLHKQTGKLLHEYSDSDTIFNNLNENPTTLMPNHKI